MQSGLRRRLAAPFVIASLITGAFGVVAPTAAYADRCEPEEIVLGGNTSPINEDDNPACTVLFFYVYPFICATDGNNPPPTLIGDGGCTANINPRPNYVPPVIPPYTPDAGRLVCNLILFALPNATCITTGDPATGQTVVDSSIGRLVIPGQPVTTEGSPTS